MEPFSNTGLALWAFRTFWTNRRKLPGRPRRGDPELPPRLREGRSFELPRKAVMKHKVEQIESLGEEGREGSARHLLNVSFRRASP